MLSCNEEAVLLEENTTEKANSFLSKEDLIIYKGLPVSKRFSNYLGALEKKGDYLSSLRKNETLNFESFTLEEIAKAVESELKKFPYLTEDGDEETKFKLLKEDFPTLTSDEINENIETIEQYYHENMDYLVLKKLSSSKNKKLKNKTTYSNETFQCVLKKGVFKDYGGSFGSEALAMFAFKKASAAKEESVKQYPEYDPTDTKQDAYRHILWNALLCRYYYTVSSKSPKLTYAKTVTDAWEICGKNREDSREMDYHNNAIGRKIYDDNAPYRKVLGMTIGIKTPSESLLKSKTKDVVENAFFIDKGLEIESVIANKIKTKTFNCVTKYRQELKYVCGDNNNFKNLKIIDPIGNGNCWKVTYIPYQSCDGSKAVYLSKTKK